MNDRYTEIFKALEEMGQTSSLKDIEVTVAIKTNYSRTYISNKIIGVSKIPWITENGIRIEFENHNEELELYSESWEKYKIDPDEIYISLGEVEYYFSLDVVF